MNDLPAPPTKSSTGNWLRFYRVSLCLILLTSLTLLSPAPTQAVQFTVCNSGCSFTTIQAAIDALNFATSGHTIKVAQGTYSEALNIPNIGLTLIGGYAPPNFTTPATDPNLTVINATGKNKSAVLMDGAGVPGLSVTFENFRVIGGTGRLESGLTRGGGIRIQAVTAIIRNNIIENNSADVGGGIEITDDHGPLSHLIENNIIRNNTARNNLGVGSGGGIDMNISNATIRGNTITGNLARCGAGMVIYASNTTIERNIINNNQAAFTNAGQGCAGSDGGALFIELVNTSPVIRNNVIAGNTASRGDGINIAIGPGQPQIVNNTIVSNKNNVGFDEGIFYVGVNITPIIRNNIVVLNGTGIQRGNNVNTPNPIISNNLVWGNSQINYSSLSPGVGDISADPQFVNQAGGNYHLQATSPAIDTGTSSNAPNVDLEGLPRPQDGNNDGTILWDMGAYEFALWLSKKVNTPAVDPGDTVIFTITYKNASGTVATNVAITDTLSANLINRSFSSNGATITPRAGPDYAWDVQNLNPSAGGSIIITAEIDPTVLTPTAIVNTAEFFSTNNGIFSSQAIVVVGGLKNYLPLILKN